MIPNKTNPTFIQFPCGRKKSKNSQLPPKQFSSWNISRSILLWHPSTSPFHYIDRNSRYLQPYVMERRNEVIELDCVQSFDWPIDFWLKDVDFRFLRNRGTCCWRRQDASVLCPGFRRKWVGVFWEEMKFFVVRILQFVLFYSGIYVWNTWSC